MLTLLSFPCRFLLVILLCALSFGGRAAPAEATPLGWQPGHTWVFVVSLVQFNDKEMFASFPTENRRDDQLVQFFRGRGVPPGHIVYCKDRQGSLRAIQAKFAALLQKASPGDTLFFYYQGHGYRGEAATRRDTFFATYDTDNENVMGWPVASITATIDRYFRGKRAILSADCCYSGSLAEVVKSCRGRIEYACLTSSSAREASTSHWTFSDCLLDGLRGAPQVDSNGDGSISMAELALYAHDEMAIAEEQHASFALAGGFERETNLARSQPKLLSPLGERVKAKQDGQWYAARIVAVKGTRFLVDYIGYDEADEWFESHDATQIQRLRPHVIATKPKFPVGCAVEVKWKGDWYAARVLKVDGSVYFIHYIEDDSSWDEWVSSRRIRAPRL